MFPETRASWKKLKFDLRAIACEYLIGWAMDICPDGYTPSCVLGAIEGVEEYQGHKITRHRINK